MIEVGCVSRLHSSLTVIGELRCNKDMNLTKRRIIKQLVFMVEEVNDTKKLNINKLRFTLKATMYCSLKFAFIYTMSSVSNLSPPII